MKKILTITISSILAVVAFAGIVNAESNSQSSFSPWAIFGNDMKPKNNVWNAILPSGKLGIGTTTPWAALSVVGNSDLGNYAQAGYYNATRTNATSTFAGDILLSNRSSAISSGAYPWQAKSGVADGATAVGYSFDTTNALNTNGSKIWSLKTGGVEQGYFANYTNGVTPRSLGGNFGSGNTWGGGYIFGDGNTTTGSNSFVAGTNSTAATYGVALGYAAIVTDTNGSLAANGGTASGYASTAIGPDNIAGAFYSTTVGGFSNYNYGYTSFTSGTGNLIDDISTVGTSLFAIVLGNSNTVSAVDGSVVLGSSNTVTSSNGSVVGASNNLSATGAYAFGSTNTLNAANTYVVGQGITNSVANSVQIGLSNTAKITVNSVGNLGVGTTSPYAKLTVWGGGVNGARVFEIANSASTTNAFIKDDGTAYFRGNVGIGTTTPGNTFLDIAAGTTAKSQFHLSSSTRPTNPVVGDHWFDGYGLHAKTNFTTMGYTICDEIATTTTTISNTIASSTLFSFTMPANSFDAGTEIRVRIDGSVSNASAADDYTLYTYLDGVELNSIARVGGNVTNAGWTFTHDGTLRTDGVSGTFVDHIRWTEKGLSDEYGYVTPKTFNTTIAHTYSVNVVWAAPKAGNTISLLNGRVCLDHQ